MPQFLVGAAIAFPVSLLLTGLLVAVGNRRGWVALPRTDRWHQQPTALYGGVAIVIACLIGAAALVPHLAGRNQHGLGGLLLGGILTFAIGLRDDIRPLNPLVKLTGQVVSCILFLVGIGLQFAPDHSELYLLSLPVAILWMLGLTNAFNLLDNMDGLTAGTAVVVGSVLAAFLSLAGVPSIGAVAGVVAAASAGFLLFNFRLRGNASIFMGDCGSMVLGFMLAGLALIGAWRLAGHGIIQGLAVPVLMMAVPIFDTTLVTVRRKLEGRSISQGGKDHSSHRLVYAGLSEKAAVMALWALSAGSGCIAMVVWKVGTDIVSLVAISALVLGFGILGATLSRFSSPKPPPLKVRVGSNRVAARTPPVDAPSAALFPGSRN